MNISTFSEKNNKTNLETTPEVVSSDVTCLEKEQDKKMFKGIDKFTLKIIGLIFMTIDHIALIFLAPTQLSYVILRNVGRLAMPIFIFTTVDSVFKTKHEIKYILTLGIEAFIYTIVCYILMATKMLGDIYIGNIFVDLFLGSLICYFLKFKNFKSFFALIPFTIYFLTVFKFNYNGIYVFPFLTDYQLFSLVLFVCIGLSYTFGEDFTRYMAKKTNFSLDLSLKYYLQRNINFLATLTSVTILLINNLLIHFNIVFINNMIGDKIFLDYGLISFIFIIFYDGRIGFTNKIIKYSFHLYYPLHLGILEGIFMLINL